MLRPGEVVHQIGKLNEALRKGDRATAPSGRDKDPIARALHNLNETIFGLVGEFYCNICFQFFTRIKKTILLIEKFFFTV